MRVLYKKKLAIVKQNIIDVYILLIVTYILTTWKLNVFFFRIYYKNLYIINRHDKKENRKL